MNVGRWTRLASLSPVKNQIQHLHNNIKAKAYRCVLEEWLVDLINWLTHVPWRVFHAYFSVNYEAAHFEKYEKVPRLLYILRYFLNQDNLMEITWWKLNSIIFEVL